MKNGIEKAALSLEPYSWMHAHRIVCTDAKGSKRAAFA
jgi:hypothetical protein